jgi:hypothetical protein
VFHGFPSEYIRFFACAFRRRVGILGFVGRRVYLVIFVVLMAVAAAGVYMRQRAKAAAAAQAAACDTPAPPPPPATPPPKLPGFAIEAAYGTAVEAPKAAEKKK